MKYIANLFWLLIRIFAFYTPMNFWVGVLLLVLCLFSLAGLFIDRIGRILACSDTPSIFNTVGIALASGSIGLSVVGLLADYLAMMLAIASIGYMTFGPLFYRRRKHS
jgi:hypothetical protein